ncbi:F0F1 ATP synthase subunit delta [Uliginosibacterium gangwonense]|uniref:F0F1 ATP synthase subunit delta n=1 Tax=Uliginosibacterium gangwonense TaxID=392736 RepID=UPI00036939A1|nr:F0F1 ATP synthase subunit delta [Uliginosibacterium gangwonense]
MLIDWFTVGAQTLNFLILVWLMKRFLYQPILHAIAAREKRITDELAAAAAKKAEATQERDTYQRKNAEFDQQRAEMLDKATEDAKAERQRLIAEAHTAIDAMRATHEIALNREQKNLHEEIARYTQREVFAIARKTLGDLAGISLEARICEVFTHRLGTLDAATKQVLAAAVGSSRPVLVRSAFELSAEQRAAILQALQVALAADVHLNFADAPDLISGIELSTAGQKLAWSIADYLASLDEHINAWLKDNIPTEATTSTQATIDSAT